jgi:hypothetical protein
MQQMQFDQRVTLGSGALPTMTSVGPVRGLEAHLSGSPSARSSFENRASVDNEFLDVGRSVSGWWNFGGLGGGMRRLSSMVGMGTGTATVVSTGSGLSVTKPGAAKANLLREEELRMQRYIVQQEFGVSGSELQPSMPSAFRTFDFYSGAPSGQATAGQLSLQGDEKQAAERTAAEERRLRRKYNVLVLLVLALVAGCAIMIYRLVQNNKDLNGQLVSKPLNVTPQVPPKTAPPTAPSVVGASTRSPTSAKPTLSPTSPSSPTQPPRQLGGRIGISRVDLVQTNFVGANTLLTRYERGVVTYDVTLTDPAQFVSGVLIENDRESGGVEVASQITANKFRIRVLSNQPAVNPQTSQDSANAPGLRWFNYATSCTLERFVLRLTFSQTNGPTTSFSGDALCDTR